jgi:hypothetical protein
MGKKFLRVTVIPLFLVQFWLLQCRPKNLPQFCFLSANVFVKVLLRDVYMFYDATGSIDNTDILIVTAYSLYYLNRLMMQKDITIRPKLWQKLELNLHSTSILISKVQIPFHSFKLQNWFIRICILTNDLFVCWMLLQNNFSILHLGYTSVTGEICQLINFDILQEAFKIYPYIYLPLFYQD